jgi:hypothetical protein
MLKARKATNGRTEAISQRRGIAPVGFKGMASTRFVSQAMAPTQELVYDFLNT